MKQGNIYTDIYFRNCAISRFKIEDKYMNLKYSLHCASVRLFPRVGPFVLLQTAWINWSIVALIALVWFLSSVFHNVSSQIRSITGWKVALCALVRFLPSVNEGVGLQITSLAKWLVALWTIVPFASTVSLPMKEKATTTSKCLGTQVTRLSICHLQFVTPPLSDSLSQLLVLKFT